MQTLNDRIAIVTGGGQGLGAAICARLAQEGAHVVIADIKLENAQRVAEEVTSVTGRKTLALACDVTNEGQVGELVSRTVGQFGRIDILVSNAGIVLSGPVEEFDLSKFQAVVNVNLIGYFLCIKHVVPVMKAQRSGSIVQINSKSGKKGSFKNSAYAASKFGGIGLTQSVALETAEFGVRCNSICPGNLLDSPLWKDSLFKQYAQNQGISEEAVRQKYIDQVPMKRPCTYEDVCNVVTFLASDQSSYMTGQAINVTGGQEMR
ncbi:MAG: sorbitol-6-phosphate dehydrogenase [Caldilineaceae bacterium]